MDDKEMDDKQMNDKEIDDKEVNPEIVQQIDLQYLLNPDQQKRLSQKFDKNMINRSDAKFYRKRFLQLTKDMLSGERVNSSLDAAFSEFFNQCVMHFKFTDKNDEIQEERNEPTPPPQTLAPKIPKKKVKKKVKKKSAETSPPTPQTPPQTRPQTPPQTRPQTPPQTPQPSQTEATAPTQKLSSDDLMMKKSYLSGNIDDFIKIRKSNVRDRNTIIPRRKDIDLRDPKLKDKGVEK